MWDIRFLISLGSAVELGHIVLWAAAYRSVRPHAAEGADPRRCVSLQSAVEFCLREKLNLVNATELTVHTFQILDAPGLKRDHIFAMVRVSLMRVHSVQ